MKIKPDNQNNCDWLKKEKARQVTSQILNNLTKRKGKIILKNRKAIFEL